MSITLILWILSEGLSIQKPGHSPDRLFNGSFPLEAERQLLLEDTLAFKALISVELLAPAISADPPKLAVVRPAAEDGSGGFCPHGGVIYPETIRKFLFIEHKQTTNKTKPLEARGVAECWQS